MESLTFTGRSLNTALKYSGWLITLFILILVTTAVKAATITSAATGNWSSTSTWVGGVVPSSTDDVIIATGHAVDVNLDVSCATLSLNSAVNWTLSKVTINTSASLTVSGNINLNATGNSLNAIILIGTLNAQGNINFNSGTTFGAVLDMTQGSGTLNLHGNLVLNSLGLLDNNLSNVSTVNFIGSSAQILLSNANVFYHNININNTSLSGVSLSGNIGSTQLYGDLTIETGILKTGGYSITGNSGDFEVQADGIYFIEGSSILPASMNHVLNSGSSVEYGGGNQTISNTTFQNLILSGTGTKSLSAQTTVAGKLEINAVTLDITLNNYGLLLGGDLLNEGTITPREGTVTFNGTNTQLISSSGSSLYNAIFNNDSGFLLDDNLTITNELTLTLGIISTGTNRLTMQNTDASKLKSHSSASYINGNFRRHIGSNFATYIFPVGMGTSANRYYLAELINNLLVGITYIDASFQPLTNHDDNDVITTDSELTYGHVRSEGVWELEPNLQPSGGSYNIRLHISNFNTAAITDNKFGIVKRPISSVSAADWTAAGTMSAPSGDGRLTSHGYALRSSLTSFSEFGIGGEGAASTLPITLLSFNAEHVDANVDLTWSTAAEINNDYFSIERSVDGLAFNEIFKMEGAGNSTTVLNYKARDKDPLQGVSYYRLKQTDFDGTVSYSNIVSVNIIGNFSPLMIYPNPANPGQSLAIKMQGGVQTNSQLNLYSPVSGSLIAKYNITPMVNQITLPNNLSQGVYILQGTVNQVPVLQKVVIY